MAQTGVRRRSNREQLPNFWAIVYLTKRAKMQDDSHRQAGAHDRVLVTLEAAECAIGAETLSSAIRIIDEWEDSTETATELAYRLWLLFHRAPQDANGIVEVS